jgi:hypothetical protein
MDAACPRACALERDKALTSPDELDNMTRRRIAMTLDERHESVRSRDDLVEFVKALREDLRDNPECWENADLERFLEALGAWVKDMDGYYRSQGKPVPQQPDWKVVADMLMGASIYE